MLAVDFSNPTAEIEAKIQSYVAKFLAGREVLVKASRSKDIDVQNKAKTLLTTQSSLEARLPSMLKVIDDAKKGVWTIGGLTGLGTFANEMISQVKDTDKLAKSAPGVTTASSFGTIAASPIALAIFGITAQIGIKLWEKSWAKKNR